MKLKRESLCLYAVTDRSWLNGESLCSQVEKAIIGGVSMVQLREKDLPFEKFLEEAYKIRELCKQYGIPLIINDSVEIAVRVNADGVHIGQDDMDLTLARELLGEDKLIGVSVHNLQQALFAQKLGANYLGVGAAFPTSSKDNAGVIGVQAIREICSKVDIPVVAIGGINENNIELLSKSGIDGVAVISVLFARSDIISSARNMRSLSEKVCAK